MKVLFIILLSVSILVADETGIGKFEIGLVTDYLNPNDTRTFVVEAVSVVWDEDFYLTGSYLYGKLEDVPEDPSETSLTDYGWDFAGSSSPASHAVDWDTIAYAKYKFYVEENPNHYFFLDYRDREYPDNYNTIRDILIKYNEVDGRFYYRAYVSYDSWHPIINGETVTIWDALDGYSPLESPNTAPFQPTNPTNLILTVVNYHPKLTWNRSLPQFATIKYKVHRKKRSGSWSLLSFAPLRDGATWSGMTFASHIYLDNDR